MKEDNSFNMKYLKKMLQKRKSISMRTNLFTGEYLPTPLYSNEPQWKSVMQESFYKLDERYVNIEQQDTLYSDNDEKRLFLEFVSIERERMIQNMLRGTGKTAKIIYILYRLLLSGVRMGSFSLAG